MRLRILKGSFSDAVSWGFGIGHPGISQYGRGHLTGYGYGLGLGTGDGSGDGTGYGYGFGYGTGYGKKENNGMEVVSEG